MEKLAQIHKQFTKVINFGDVTDENRKYHKKYLLKIPDHPHKILITGYSGSEKKINYLNY